MPVFEITGFKTGVDKSGVNFLSPADSFQNIEDGFVYRQELVSRKGIGYFADALASGTRIMGIWEFEKPDGNRELLVADTDNLYTYVKATNSFTQIPFAGSLAVVPAYAGFGLGSSPEAYISGVAYPDKDNAARFILCGEGLSSGKTSAIFVYNGTDVRDFCNATDNPSYQTLAGETLTSSKFVTYFNERLNFIVPTLGTQRNQSVLYSGIKDSNGNGDKFNVAGSGIFEFSTYQSINSFEILGEELCLLFSKSSRFLQVTADPFNPYKQRSIPSPLGTDAAFSAVSWANRITSVGKLGIITNDGRESLKTDNKIRDFTSTVIDQPTFDLTSGGFDRLNGQFLWSYKEGGLTENETQDKILVKNYEEDSWSIFNLQLSVFGETTRGQNLVWDDIDETAGDPSWETWGTTEDVWGKIGLGEEVTKTLVGDDNGFIYELDKDYDDHVTAITGITKASQAVLTVGASSFRVGDQVVVEGVVGMTEINNFDPLTSQINITPYTVTAVGATTVTLNVDSNLFTTYTSNGLLSKPVNFYAETIPLNPFREKGNKIFISHVEVLMNTDGGFVKMDVLENTSRNIVLRDLPLTTTSTKKEKEWVTVQINHEADFITLVFKQFSPSTQLKISSVRIHAEEGGATSG